MDILRTYRSSFLSLLLAFMGYATMRYAPLTDQMTDGVHPQPSLELMFGFAFIVVAYGVHMWEGLGIHNRLSDRWNRSEQLLRKRDGFCGAVWFAGIVAMFVTVIGRFQPIPLLSVVATQILSAFILALGIWGEERIGTAEAEA